MVWNSDPVFACGSLVFLTPLTEEITLSPLHTTGSFALNWLTVSDPSMFWKEHFLSPRSAPTPHGSKGATEPASWTQHILQSNHGSVHPPSTQSQTPPAIKTASFPKQAESLYLKNDQTEKQREVYSKQKDHLRSTAQGISSGKDPRWTGMFSAVNSDCKKSIGVLFHKVWARAQGQKNRTTVLPNNSAKWQPVLSES